MASGFKPVISPSLINPDWNDPNKFRFDPNFDLGMGDWLTDVAVLPADSEEDMNDTAAEWLSQLPDLSCIVDESDRVEPSNSRGDTSECSSKRCKAITAIFEAESAYYNGSSYGVYKSGSWT